MAFSSRVASKRWATAYEENKRGGGNRICVAFVGINFAEQHVSFEGQALANPQQEVQTTDPGSCPGRAAI
jgi:hypothetical protein